ncbi:MAG: hypothetical protein QOD39_2653 [Mycobacterium sp.]|jgi:hypothetical protein|nr:hypothetical protein [Mycobacterium sp.]
MTIIISGSIVVIFGFIIEWSQRHCEAWAFQRDKDL